MSSGDSVSQWLDGLQAADEAAVRALWQRYFPRLVGLAREKLREAPRRIADEEDVALSAFGSFCRAARAGRFPDLRDHDGLWALLMVITARKAAHLLRDQGRQKRGGAVTVEGELTLEQVLSREPSPEFAAQAAEEFQRLLDLLGDPILERVAVCRMEGYSVEEIAEKVGYRERSIKRKLDMIRRRWEKEAPP